MMSDLTAKRVLLVSITNLNAWAQIISNKTVIQAEELIAKNVLLNWWPDLLQKFYVSNIWKCNEYKELIIDNWNDAGNELKVTFGIDKKKGISGIIVIKYWINNVEIKE